MTSTMSDADERDNPGITAFPGVGPLPDVSPGRSVFFHPQQPNEQHLMFHFLKHVGWRIVDRPEAADWRVLYHLDTKIVLAPDDPYAGQAGSWLNGRCRDISKRQVELDFANVFGYELDVDPTTYRGHCLRKADANSVKDAVVLDCPIAANDIRQGQVYERLVAGSQPDGSLIEHRVFVVGGLLPVVRRDRIGDWHRERRLNKKHIDQVLVNASDEFSPSEIARMLEFCHVSGLDLGALDVIRDSDNGRIYVLDVTKTPGTAQWTRGSAEYREGIAGPFCRAWQAEFLPLHRHG